MIGDEFVQAVTIRNPGEPAPVLAQADVWQSTPGEFESDGTLRSTWTATFPPGTVIEPLAEVVVGGRLLWVSGVPEARSDLLTGLPDHIEATLKSTDRVETTADIYRDSNPVDRNAFGDPVETGGAPVLTGVLISITQTGTRPPTDVDGSTIDSYVAWVAADTDVRYGDRIVTADNSTYAVEKVDPPQASSGLLDQRLELRRVT